MPPWNYAVPGLQRKAEVKAPHAQAEEKLAEEPQAEEKLAEEPAVPATALEQMLEEPQAEEPAEEPAVPATALEETAEEPAKQPPEQLAVGSVVARPNEETRFEFVMRVKAKNRGTFEQTVKRVKKVPGLWELWPNPEEELTAQPRKRKASAEPKAEPKAKARPDPAEPKRSGAPCSNAGLKKRILQGGTVDSLEEYSTALIFIGSEQKQETRLVRSNRTDELEATREKIQKYRAAADAYAVAHGLSRVRVVEDKQRHNNLKVQHGIRLIKEGSMGNSDLLTQELSRGS